MPNENKKGKQEFSYKKVLFAFGLSLEGNIVTQSSPI
jgi:hypothetical protein